MKRKILLMALLIPLTMSSAVLAEDKAVSVQPSMSAASEAQSSADQHPGAHVPMRPKHGMGMHKGNCQHGDAQGDRKHDGAQGKGMHQKHAEVVQRLDRIERRMARMEDMLRALLQR